jgi:hypothetical protein
MTPGQIIANFLKPPGEGGAYADENLAALLAHAEEGRLSFVSCCCLTGIPTADHALVGKQIPVGDHFEEALRVLPNAGEANAAFALFFDDPTPTGEGWDAQRRAKLIPLIKAEFERRARLRAEVEAAELVTA